MCRSNPTILARFADVFDLDGDRQAVLLIL
jgi:hypothetical protein